MSVTARRALYTAERLPAKNVRPWRMEQCCAILKSTLTEGFG